MISFASCLTDKDFGESGRLVVCLCQIVSTCNEELIMKLLNLLFLNFIVEDLASCNILLNRRRINRIVPGLSHSTYCHPESRSLKLSPIHSNVFNVISSFQQHFGRTELTILRTDESALEKLFYELYAQIYAV